MVLFHICYLFKDICMTQISFTPCFCQKKDGWVEVGAEVVVEVEVQGGIKVFQKKNFKVQTHY